MSGFIKKITIALRREGLKGTFVHSIRYIKKKIIENGGNITPLGSKYPPLVDVLFINGCGAAVPHPARYRVTHQREQLNAGNITSNEVFYEELSLDMVKYANVFVFFRCPHTEIIGEFIELAKSLNKTVLFDIDDLVVDTKYTDQILYVQNLKGAERELYDDGVRRMGQTLCMCEAAITTTERLAAELSNYVPEVFINRNTASEMMYSLSEKVTKDRNDDEIRIGYFSGSITHNDDFKLVQDTLCKLMTKYPNVRLYLVGELDLPKELEAFKNQIVVSPFVDWTKLPQLIASVDINIAPLETGIFNESKSENKWVEAALVKVVTVASKVGAFERMIKDKETGFLCSSSEEWESVLEELINSKELRAQIASKAYSYCIENCLTINSAQAITEYIKDKMEKSVALVLPSTEISGGIMVALKHAVFLHEEGYAVTIIAYNPSLDWIEFEGYKFPVISYGDSPIHSYFNKAIATMWVTTPFVETHPKIKNRYYLVQGYEVDFYEPNVPLRIQACQTYNLNDNIQYLTISKWCEEWLINKYHKKPRFAPNGMDRSHFPVTERDFSSEKIRILIEGDCAVDYKMIDESFRITNKLDKSKFEVWYMSYNEKPKSWYECDKFLHRVPYDEVPSVYNQCHILLKSSVLESFSYPPLEMMATGGYVVAVQNGGNSQYLVDGENCLIYETGNEEKAISCINRICEDSALREKLKEAAIKTADEHDWSSIRADILKLYEAN